jgi:hypothetical protein
MQHILIFVVAIVLISCSVMRQFGTTACADAVHTLSFTFEDYQPLAITNCGPGIGRCNIAQTCCSADNHCGSGNSFC